MIVFLRQTQSALLSSASCRPLARALLSVAGMLGAGATAAIAQSSYGQPTPQPGYVNPFAPPTEADQLAQQLRLVAADPTNLYALVNAARLSLAVGDIDGAAALYTRAEKASPGNPQVKAGMARLLVQSERPGEALRLFQEAAARGANEADFGSDRALAYDLIGEHQRAQREYRAVLRRGADDEATRRYALSLGMSGLRDPALALLEPLNRRSDRGAWRARAFVLAMTGDRAGAERIATTMMPAGMAAGLRPFFDRLPQLNATDRAFAVHFGQVRASPTRMADARRAPPLPALSPEPDPFPAARQATQQVAAASPKKKSRKDRRREAEQVAQARPVALPLPPPPAPSLTQLAALNANRLPPHAAAFGSNARSSGVTVLPPPADAYGTRRADAQPARPATTDVSIARATTQRLAEATAVPSVPPAPATQAAGGAITSTNAPVALAAVDRAPPVVRSTATFGNAAVPSSAPLYPALSPTALSTREPERGAVLGLTSRQPAVGGGVAQVAGAGSTIEQIAVGTTQSVTLAPAGATAQNPALSGVPQVATNAAAPVPGFGTSNGNADALAPTSTAVPVASSPTGDVGTPPPPKGEDGDAVLAAIIAGIQVPASELRPAAQPPAPLLETIARKAEAPVRTRPEPRAKPDPKEHTDAEPADTKTKADTRAKLDARGRPIDPKGKAADKTGADKAAAGKPPAKDAKKPDPAKTEPARIWVQVAGGANEDTLGRAWKQTAAQSAALKGKQGWTTPLRATNRVLTGPFKTSAEAMALVNRLKKEGVSAFMFTSEAGQKITRLPAE